MGWRSTVCFRNLSKVLNQMRVYLSHIESHEVGLVLLFKDVFKNIGSFCDPVLPSLVCGSQPQGYKMAEPPPVVVSASQPRESESKGRKDPASSHF